MTVQELANQMRRKANETPFYPGRSNPLDFRRDMRIEGYVVKVTFTRTMVGSRQFYQLSVGNDEGDPSLIPRSLIQKVRAIFVPNGLPLPSALGNCIQFLEEINDQN